MMIDRNLIEEPIKRTHETTETETAYVEHKV
jgi:hypothetical protein